MTTSEAAVYAVNSPQVVSEAIDGEVVIVNLELGNYYSLLGAGACIWAGIERRQPTADILADLEQRFDGATEELEAALRSFLCELNDEKLIVTVPISDSVDESGSNGTPDAPGTSEKQPFVAPKLDKYTDMQDLLLLDPIHEVDDEKGWPNTAGEDAANSPA